MSDVKRSPSTQENGRPYSSGPDPLAEAFGETLRVATTAHVALEEIIGVLNKEWEGAMKPRFLDSLRATTGRIRDRLLPRLRALEETYRRRTGDSQTG